MLEGWYMWLLYLKGAGGGGSDVISQLLQMGGEGLTSLQGPLCLF